MAEATSQTIVNQKIRLRHVGYVVRSTNEVADRFAQSAAASWDQEIIQDPLQDAKVAFLAGIVQEFPLVDEHTHHHGAAPRTSTPEFIAKRAQIEITELRMLARARLSRSHARMRRQVTICFPNARNEKLRTSGQTTG
jgi:hypothetical protein